MLFINTNNTSIVACVINEERPKDNILKISLSNLKSFFSNFTDFILFKYKIAIINEIIYPMIVANALP